MKAGTLSLVLVLSLLSGCTSAQPASAPPPPTAVEGTVPASPPPIAGSPAPLLAGADGPLSTTVAARWQGSPVLWRAAVLDTVVDPQNPLGLTPQEQKTVGADLKRLMAGEEEVAARSAILQPLLGDLWKSPGDDRSGPSPWPEDAFSALLPLLEKDLAKAAQGKTATATALGADVRDPESGGGEDDPEDDFPRRPDQVVTVLEDVGPDLSPEQAASALAELQAMQAPVKEMASAWEGLLALTGSPERQKVVNERAASLKGNFDMMEINDRVMKYLASAG